MRIIITNESVYEWAAYYTTKETKTTKTKKQEKKIDDTPSLFE